jgi:uncharacterized protein
MTEIAKAAEITSLAELTGLIGTPAPRTVANEHARLIEEDRDWIAAARLCLIATAAADGTCDVSPKGDPAGFAHVVDDVTIAIPDRPGNRRADGFRNILGNPHVGLLFLVPGRGATLRINGRARLLRDAPFFDQMTAAGHRPRIVILVDIEQIYFHCPKAFRRSQLWEPGTWPADELPSAPQVLRDNFQEISREITGDPHACDNAQFADFIRAAAIPPAGAAAHSAYRRNAISVIRLFGGDPGLRTAGAVRRALASIALRYWDDLTASVTAGPAAAAPAPGGGLGIPAPEWGNFVRESMRDAAAAAALLAYHSHLASAQPAQRARPAQPGPGSGRAPAPLDDFLARCYRQAGARAGDNPAAIAGLLSDGGGHLREGGLAVSFAGALAESGRRNLAATVRENLDATIGALVGPGAMGNDVQPHNRDA